jgi:hypothetical protein
MESATFEKNKGGALAFARATLLVVSKIRRTNEDALRAGANAAQFTIFTFNKWKLLYYLRK